jgi:DNA-binding transcriptional regulator WhiA
MTWRPPDPWSYSYLLGMYLGDGCVSANRRSFQLVVVCDAAYPNIIEDCWRR